ncbi:MAG: hypothetical protein QM493_05185 [Sulfurovum sp.]
MTKEEFYKFGIMMQENSNILFVNNKYHTSVYLGGYVLEAYIKMILIYKGKEDYIGHLGDSEFLNKFRSVISTHPEFSDNILQTTNINYPKMLFNGQGNNTTKASWKIEHRYKVDNWTDETFCQKVQLEVQNIKSSLMEIRITMGLNL